MRQSKRGLLLVISGPAGVGKGTVNGLLLKRRPDVVMSVSATTRAPRPGEIDGVHYFFKTPDEFSAMVERGEFLEYMQVFQKHSYGTPKAFVSEQLERGNHVILEIDVQGARKVKEAFPDAVRIFLAPPSMETLKDRLTKRGTETAEEIARRTATAYTEMRDMPACDYIVVNDDLETAVLQVEAIIEAERCRVAHNADTINEFLGGIQSC